MRTRVKICGITRFKDALFASEAGADALGFVFYEKSPRYMEAEAVRNILQNLPPMVTAAGVFVDEEINKVKEISDTCPLDLLQFHGGESPEYCQWYSQRVMKAFRVKDIVSVKEIKRYAVSACLLDSYSEEASGGTGKTFDWSLAREAASLGPVLLAGGLTPENVMQAIEEVRPYGVDVSTGVESAPGIKDHDKIRRFIQAVREADQKIYGVKSSG